MCFCIPHSCNSPRTVTYDDSPLFTVQFCLHEGLPDTFSSCNWVRNVLNQTLDTKYPLQPFLQPVIPAMGSHIPASVLRNNYCLARRNHECRATSIPWQQALCCSESETASSKGELRLLIDWYWDKEFILDYPGELKVIIIILISTRGKQKSEKKKQRDGRMKRTQLNVSDFKDREIGQGM